MSQTAEIIQLHERPPKVKADTDDGWHKIATTLARKECSVDMSRSEWKVYNTVKLRTFGFRKSMDWVAAVQFEEETGIKANKISEIKQRLVDRNILKADGRKVGVNTVVSDWSEKPITPKQGYKTLPLNRVAITPIQDSFTPKQGNKYPQTGVHNKKDTNNKITTIDLVSNELETTDKNTADYPDEFVWIWESRPRRSGSDSKKKAFQNCNARIKQGFTWKQLAEGMVRYRNFCAATQKLGSEYVMQMTRFFGTEEQFNEDWVIAAPTPPNTPQTQRAAISAAIMNIEDTNW